MVCRTHPMVRRKLYSWVAKGAMKEGVCLLSRLTSACPYVVDECGPCRLDTDVGLYLGLHPIGVLLLPLLRLGPLVVAVFAVVVDVVVVVVDLTNNSGGVSHKLS